MAGTLIGISNVQQNDINGAPLAGALLTIYQGGSTSALANVFQDISLLIPAPNPLTADASGRIPQFFLSDGSYGARLTDQFGVQSNGGFFIPQIPSIGASSSGGGGSVVDPTTVFSTGDVKWRLEQNVIPGWVRLNKRTIGNASSGASERANADCQALFIYIWSTYSDAICPVLGGRGASALADFSAGKQITLLDSRGKDIRGLDDMGNAAAGAFTNVPFQTGNATTGGASCGTNATTLTLAQIPTGITSANTAAIAISVTSTTNQVALNQSPSNIQGNPANPVVFPGNFSALTSTGNIPIGAASVTSNNTGGQAFPSVPSALLGTLFWKL